ncbi:hypothetical protein [Pseudomonas brenneri]|uniref:hypothetical protein n=1 Tax=Pseudomonas brenneri TaxID=129817 RepID=UPI003BA298C7
MAPNDEYLNALNAWAPNLGEVFTTLGYLGSPSSTAWLASSPRSSDLRLLFDADGHVSASEMWRKILREDEIVASPVFMLILEHMRRNPVDMSSSLKDVRLDFSKSLANIAHRAADALYEDAKGSFAGHEIDVAIARYRVALSEFRFSIESQVLTESARRIATGKYATAVAMIGRWVQVSPATVSRALSYSKESMTLGNLKPETLTYRLELLVQQFDQTGDENLLQDALKLLSENPKIVEGSELAEVEARLRLALLSDSGIGSVRFQQLKIAKLKLTRSRPRETLKKTSKSGEIRLSHELNG